jgi:hypothetical protein
MRSTTLLLCLVACTKAAPPPVPDVPEPADLLLVVSAAAPRAVLERGAAYAEAVKPGAGAGFSEAMLLQGLAATVGASRLQGLDLGKPLHLLLLDPRVQPKPVVLVAGVADEARIKALTGPSVRVVNGVALIGAEPALAIVADHALWLAGRPAPAAPTLSLSPGKLVERYRKEIGDFRTQMGRLMAGQSPGMGKILEVEIDLFLELADQTDRLAFLIDVTPADAWLELGLRPKAGTPFAGFVAAQKPGVDDSLLALLPPVEKPSMVMAGRWDMGPMRAPLLDLAFGVYEEMAGRKLEPAERQRWNEMIDLFDGRLAAVSWSTEDGRFQMQELLGVSDGPKLAAYARELFPAETKPFELMGMKMSLSGKPEAATHAGVTISEYRFAVDLSALPEMQRAITEKMYGPDGLAMHAAGFDKAFVLGMGPEAMAGLPALIDGARAGTRSPPPAPVAKVMKEAAGRKASFVAVMDLAQTMAPLTGKVMPASASGLSMEGGVTDGAFRLRVAMPAAHVAEVGRAMGGAL